MFPTEFSFNPNISPEYHLMAVQRMPPLKISKGVSNDHPAGL